MNQSLSKCKQKRITENIKIMPKKRNDLEGHFAKIKFADCRKTKNFMKVHKASKTPQNSSKI